MDWLSLAGGIVIGLGPWGVDKIWSAIREPRLRFDPMGVYDESAKMVRVLITVINPGTHTDSVAGHVLLFNNALPARPLALADCPPSGYEIPGTAVTSLPFKIEAGHQEQFVLYYPDSAGTFGQSFGGKSLQECYLLLSTSRQRNRKVAFTIFFKPKLDPELPPGDNDRKALPARGPDDGDE